MDITLESPNLCTITSCTIYSSLKSETTNKSKQQKQNHLNQKNKLSFPKSSPTPLLTNQKPYPQTKIQALDSVVDDLESSINNGIEVNAHIFVYLLQTCFHLQAINQGTRIHRLIPKNLLRKNIGLLSKLLILYASCGHIEDAHQVFDQMTKCQTLAFSWNTVTSEYAELGLYEDAFALYFQMVEDNVDQFTFPRVLKACSGLRLIQLVGLSR